MPVPRIKMFRSWSVLALLCAVIFVTGCSGTTSAPGIGTGEAYLGGDNLSTVAQVHEALAPAKAKLLTSLQAIARGEQRQRLIASDPCDPGEPLCRHSAPFSMPQRTDARDTIVAWAPEMARIVEGNVSPISLVSHAETVSGPSGTRTVPSWTLPAVGSSIYLSVPLLQLSAPADLSGVMISLLTHELLHQVTGLADEATFRSFLNAEGFRECATFAGVIVRDYAEPAWTEDPVVGSPGASTGSASPMVTCSSSTTGSVNVVFTNRTVQSSQSRVALSCATPVLLAESEVPSVACGTGSAATSCESRPEDFQTGLYAQVTLGQAELQLSLRSGDPVWVGAASPYFPVDYTLACLPGSSFYSSCQRSSTSAQVEILGNARVTFKNGTRASSQADLPLPATCATPRVKVFSYTGDVQCKAGAGAGACPSAPTRFTQGVSARVVTDGGRPARLELVTVDPVWVGPSSPYFAVAYQIVCQ